MIAHMGAALVFTLAAGVQAGSVTADIIHVSTLAAQSGSQGILVATNVYLAAGSSLTLKGSGGYMTSDSSITASAFFGDGSHLANVASLGGDNVFSGGNNFASSFTVRSDGRSISLSTGPNTNNILIGANGAVSFSPTLHNSSATSVPEASTTNSEFGPCIVSTITITTSGGRVELVFTGTFKFEPAFVQDRASISFLQDGQFVRDLSAAKGFVVMGQTSGEIYMPMRLAYLLDAPSPGTHSYCLTLSADNAHATTLSASSGNLFYVKELK